MKQKKKHMSLANFYKWPHFDDNDINAVSEVLKSAKVNRWTGTKNIEFEKKLSEITNCDYAIALTNGTVALELALFALDIKEGDEVIVPCKTFIATASAVVARGAKPVVADVSLETQNITAKSIETCITKNTKAIIVVHLAGCPCDMDSILALAKKYKLFVIEDCAQAHGAKYKDKSVGSFGDIAAWSFCQDKIITTCGEGGAVTTNSEKLWRKMWEYKDHGKSYDAIFNSKNTGTGFRWTIESFGTNFRLSEMACAQGILSLEKLEGWVKTRRANARLLDEALSKFASIRLSKFDEFVYHSYYKYCCFLKLENLKNGWDRNRIKDEITKQGLPCFEGACWNISAEKCFKDKGWEKSDADLPNAAILKDTSLMFLVHPTITQADMLEAVKIIENVLKEATK